MATIPKRIGPLLWFMGLIMVTTGGLIHGPALGIGMTIDDVQWRAGHLEFRFQGQSYQVELPGQNQIPPTIHIITHYTTRLAEWDSILLLGQDLEVRAASGQVIYQTDTTRLRLAQPAVARFSAGQVADALSRLGTAACIIGPCLVMLRGRWVVPALWLAVVMAYLGR